MSVLPRVVPGRACGSCMLCCKVPYIEEFEKPPGVWCRHAAAGKGCTIYGSHPPACRAFYCHWMLDASFGPQWKPDRAKFVVYRPAQWHQSSGRRRSGLPAGMDTAAILRPAQAMGARGRRARRIRVRADRATHDRDAAGSGRGHRQGRRRRRGRGRSPHHAGWIYLRGRGAMALNASRSSLRSPSPSAPSPRPSSCAASARS